MDLSTFLMVFFRPLHITVKVCFVIIPGFQYQHSDIYLSPVVIIRKYRPPPQDVICIGPHILAWIVTVLPFVIGCRTHGIFSCLANLQEAHFRVVNESKCFIPYTCFRIIVIITLMLKLTNVWCNNDAAGPIYASAKFGCASFLCHTTELCVFFMFEEP